MCGFDKQLFLFFPGLLPYHQQAYSVVKIDLKSN